MDEEVKAAFNKITGSSIFRRHLVDIRGERTSAESLWLCPVNKREARWSQGEVRGSCQSSSETGKALGTQCATCDHNK